MQRKKIDILLNILFAVLFLIAATFLGAVFQHLGLHKTNIVVVYIFSVLLISRFTTGYFYGIISSVVSILLFNWFFTEPFYTLKVNDMTYIVTFAIMMLISVFTSAITTKAKKSAEEAREREKESNALYLMTNHLTDTESTDEIAEITITAVADMLGCSVSFIGFDEKGVPENTFIQRKEDGTIIRRKLDDTTELHKRINQLHTAVDITEKYYDYPVYGKASTLAVLRIPRNIGELMSASQTRMLHSVLESAALALEHLQSMQAQAKSREETTQERYRANLLRAISHDIRTPLSGIMGTSEMLMGTLSPEEHAYTLAKDIYGDALWLHGMVENILNLTRLQDGKLTLDKQPEAVEEVISAALMVMEKRLPDRSVDVEIPDNVIIAPMDARLISQVLVNLLENAAKHTPKEKEIGISVKSDEKNVEITVFDRGNGISPQDLPHIFKMFYTTSGKIPDARQGVGLGLAICQSIVEAHGGNISAENRGGGGALFKFSLPLEVTTHDKSE